MDAPRGREGPLGLGGRSGRATRTLAALVAAPRWPSGDPRAVGLAAACMVVALSPLALPGDGDFEGAHLVLLLLLGLAGVRLRLPLAMATAIAAEALLAAQRVAAAEATRETVMAIAWTILGPAVVAGAFTISEAPRRRVRAAADAAVHSMLRALAAKDGATGEHSDTVADLAVAVGRGLGIAGDRLSDLRAVACMHDVGKLAVPQEVLDRPGPLTPREWELMRRHPEAGAEIAAEIPSLAHLAPVLVAVHERWDGDGYPHGIAGERIPLLARIVFCCDAFEAMTADRPYDVARTPEEAVVELRDGAGTQFDPTVVAAFLTVLAARGLHTPAGPSPPAVGIAGTTDPPLASGA
ncbi:HD-GYP domain-containing protein [Miltoncostaea oceani]|uniref:HD-GYP domain-containing protein n=1 Tax=Miltoncostaea oceani TaxID=2843216 RepID=UPI001C3D9B33|nr:HD-GYP domain-containing protein [Miltoncostaea oceani]